MYLIVCAYVLVTGYSIVHLILGVSVKKHLSYGVA
nr:MAG TPA: hypothetical protein [Caudoviricetes sp.]